MFDRIVRAIRLDRTLYREVADNPAYMNEAVIIVVVVSLLAAIGQLFTGGIGAYILQVVNGILFGWVLWAVVAYYVGAKFFNGRSSVQEMLRTLGYANAPRILGLLGFIPCVGFLFAIAGWVLSILAGVIAIREIDGVRHHQSRHYRRDWSAGIPDRQYRGRHFHGWGSRNLQQLRRFFRKEKPGP